MALKCALFSCVCVRVLCVGGGEVGGGLALEASSVLITPKMVRGDQVFC